MDAGNITKLYGPPITIGQQLKGLVDFPWFAFIGEDGLFSSPVPLYGWRINTVGTSLPGKSAIPPRMPRAGARRLVFSEQEPFF